MTENIEFMLFNIDDSIKAENFGSNLKDISFITSVYISICFSQIRRSKS